MGGPNKGSPVPVQSVRSYVSNVGVADKHLESRVIGTSTRDKSGHVKVY